MQYRLVLPFVLVAALAAAGCGGGGSSGAAPPAPTPTPTPNANCAALAPQTVGSTYTLSSNPSGVPVQRVDPNTGCTYLNALTLATDIPQTAPHPWQYVFGSGSTPYIVPITQTLNGPHTLFYNQSGDSSGSVNVSSLQSLRRGSTAHAVNASGVLRRTRTRLGGAGIVANKVMVRYRGAAAQLRSAARAVEAAERTGGFDVPAPAGFLQRVVAVPAGTDATAFAVRLRARPEVAGVFPLHTRVALSRPAVAVSDEHMQNQVDQWYLFAAGFPNGWAYGTGSAGVHIAMIDTGADLNNSDLASKIDFSTSYVTPTAQDTNGHGTNTAAIAAAATNNLTGFAGAGFNVRLFVYNIFGDATASDDKQTADVGDEARAIADAVARGADVVSLSLGSAENYTGDGYDQTEHDAVEAALAAGVTVVAAAGNDADGSETGVRHTVLDYPAAYDGVLSVGASALRDNNSGSFAGSTEYVAPYSQYGPGLGVVAPGGDPAANDSSPLHWIWNYSTSTAAFGTGPGDGDKCSTPSPATMCSAFFAGSSQATPQVSAAAALLIAAAGGHGSLSPARVAQLIDGTADNLNDPHQGHGRLNAGKALAALFGDTDPFSGPAPAGTSPAQLVAFAYDNSGGTTPHVLDQNYPKGVPVDANGGFRIADVLPNAGSYRVGVWYDANGDGIIDAGDQFGSPATSCNPQQRCVLGAVTLQRVGAGFQLP